MSHNSLCCSLPDTLVLNVRIVPTLLFNQTTRIFQAQSVADVGIGNQFRQLFHRKPQSDNYYEVIIIHGLVIFKTRK